MAGVGDGEGDARSHLEVVPEELVALLDVEDHVLVGGADLVVELPAAVDDLEGASLDELLGPVLVGVVLAEEPAAEVFSFIVSECALGVLPQSVHHVVEQVREVRLQQVALSPGEEVVDCPEEGRVVGVGHQVHHQGLHLRLRVHRRRQKTQQQKNTII